MSTSNKPIFVVSCAAGHQGRSVINALLKENKFRIRGLVRDDTTDRARELKEKGIELIKCDVTNTDNLRKALQGVEVFYTYTDYFDKSQKGKEKEVGMMMVDEAKRAGVKHLIWSWLPNAKRISKGKFNLPLFTHKGEVGEYALQQLPTTLVGPGFYFQNFSELFTPKREQDGTLVYTLPNIKMLPGIDIDELGEVVLSIANRREEWIGKTVPVFGDNMPMQKYIDQLGTKQRVRLNSVSIEEFGKLNIDCAKDLAEMFSWIDEYGYYGPEINLDLGKRLNQNLKNFHQFVQSAKITPK